MGYIYEKVVYNKYLPAKILMQDKPGRRCNTSLHWHKEIEIVYMIQGCLHIRINGVETTIQEGEFYLCNSEDIHVTYVDNMEVNYTYLVILLSYEELENYFPKLEKYMFQVNKKNRSYDALVAQFEQLISLNKLNDPYIALKEKKCIYEIFHILLSNCLIEKSLQPQVKKISQTMHAKEIERYIGENYKEKLTLQNVAQTFGFSPQYFSKYFHRITDSSFVSYVQQVRLRHALEDMLNKDLSVTQTAYENGFTNVKSFITTCKRYAGVTPMQYKKEIIQENSMKK